jgi:murein DD-endopeptidase MepM/ murein hydrolase activator NlpD
MKLLALLRKTCSSQAQRQFIGLALALITISLPALATPPLPPAAPSHLGLPMQSFVFPIMSPRKSSSFGDRKHPVLRYLRHHNGIDLAAPSGAQIRSIAAGTVIFADPYAGYGNLVVVKHSGRFTSHYGHCQQILVRPGERLKPGQVLATVGETGLSSGPHLHFELRLDGNPQNPEDYLPGLVDEAAG